MRNLLICVVLGGLLLGRPASAQTDQSTTRVPVVLAMVDSLGGSEPPFRIVRLAEQSALHIVLLPPDATPELLAQALETLRTVWAGGDRNEVGASGAMFRRVTSTTARSRPAPPWADRVLHDLREARPRHVLGIGHVQAVQIWLAPLPGGMIRSHP